MYLEWKRTSPYHLAPSPWNRDPIVSSPASAACLVRPGQQRPVAERLLLE
jgi:hypothetical protein